MRPVSMSGLAFGLVLGLSSIAFGSATDPEEAAVSVATIPWSFEANRGQVADPDVLFVARPPGFQALVTRDGLRLRPADVAAHGSGPLEPEELRLTFVGASWSAHPVGGGELVTRSNYILGPDPTQWITGIPHHATVRIAGLYPGTDVLFYEQDTALKYDLIVEPGADPDLIRMGWSGPGDVSVDGDGNLHLPTALGQVIQQDPLVYQEQDGVRCRINARFSWSDAGTIGFDLGEFDRTLPLVIDPVIQYATYLGGSDVDRCDQVAVDAAGNLYVTGRTKSLDFPLAGPVQATNQGNFDAFVAKLDSTLSMLIYSTYIGGAAAGVTYFEGGRDIEVDANGSAHVCGVTSAADFPVLNAAQPLPGGLDDAFVFKLAPDGASLMYSTFLGGSGSDLALRLALDTAGAVFVTGGTPSTDFPTLNAFQPNMLG